MKRWIILVILLLSVLGIVAAENNGWLLYYVNKDWFSVQKSNDAPIPPGLEDMTEREEEIYRSGYANGHYDALHPAYVKGLFVVNKKTKKFHLSNCMNTLMIEIDNREHKISTPEELMNQGYKPCGSCHPEREVIPAPVESSVANED